MANREPAKCAKAVQGFWNNERDFIKQGQGTRNWTSQEQIEIMNFKPSGSERKNAAAPTYGQGERGEYGMNYDKYEGQHMKSAEAHPEFQGEPNNIQALTRDEHQQAHNGDFRNPTNGYYDPQTGQMTDFGDNPPTNLQPQQLSEPYVDSAEYQYIQNSIDNTQAVLNDFEQNKAKMQNPTQDNFQEILDNYDQMKADMQGNNNQQNHSSNQFEGEASGMNSGGIASGGGMDM